jgi:6-phosphogluconolactonase
MSFLNGQLIVPGDKQASYLYCANHFIESYHASIQDHDSFAVALSGGSTPRPIYEMLCSTPYASEIDWAKVHLFWSDERAVPPTSPDSNFKMAMECGFNKMPLMPPHIHRMRAEDRIEEHAKLYEKDLIETLDHRGLDLVILGMGDDGHTASLFPQTPALSAKGKLATANYVPSKKSWRMTLTFEAINQAIRTVFYVFGVSKAPMLAKVFSSEPHLPCQYVGSPAQPALWIADLEAASTIKNR